MKVIITGATGMVGEGVLYRLLQRNDVEKVLSISRKPSLQNSPKLKEIIHKDFYDLSVVAGEMKGYDAVFFCLGISSIGLPKDEYFKITNTLTLHFAETYLKQNPGGTFCYISGAGTDSSEKGNGWAAVKGKTENQLVQLFGKRAFNFRPAFIKPVGGKNFIAKFYKYIGWMFPLGRKVYPKGFTNTAEIADAMLYVSKNGYVKQILEGDDIIKAAGNLN